MKLAKPLVVTAGEPAGIGPDLCIALAATDWAAEFVVIGNREVLAARAKKLGKNVSLYDYSGEENRRDGLALINHEFDAPVECGVLNPANAAPLLDGLKRAYAGCLSGEFSAMVTAPLQKSVIVDAGIPFSGHTEFLAELGNSGTPVMLLVADNLRVALASTHLPLRDVPDFLTTAVIVDVLEVLHRDLQAKFAISEPRILVCGLNPHAGENNYLGSEDQQIIRPAIEKCRKLGMDVIGPLPADTAFTPAAGPSDAILAMYHDQGLPVIKYAGFGAAVNVTLGLPLIRTSVDHGTALDIAGSGTAHPGSMIAALELAADLVRRQ